MLRVRTIVTGVTGTPWYYNHYYGGTTSGEAAQALVATKAWVDGLKAIQYTGLTSQVQADVAYMNPTTGDVLGIYAGSSATYLSTGAGARSSYVDQILVRLRTGVYNAGREIRGRWFLPGIRQVAYVNGGVDASFITSINGINNSLLTAGTGAGGLVVWSRTGGLTAQVTTMPVWDQVAVQRSRRD